MSDPQFDAIVVGSGITGGWAAKELTERGLKVLMIERGRNIEHGAYETEVLAPWEMPFRGQGDPDLWARDFAVQKGNRAFNEWTQDHFVNDRENPYSTAPGTEFTWWRSYQLGGRSLTWGRQCYRWSDTDFGANKADGHGTDWPIRYADLAPWYDHVEDFIGVSGSSEGLDQLPDGRFLPPMALNAVETHAKKAVAARWPDRHIIAGRVANLTAEKPGRSPCQYRNICARGCSYGAYFSTQSSTLPAAEATGRLTVVTDAIVERVDVDPKTGRATGVSVVDTSSGTRRSYTSRLVFLNAGAFNSVHLLLRSGSDRFPNGLANSSGMLGRFIMDHANTLAAVATVPSFEERGYYGNRPNGIIIPRFRNLANKPEGHDFLRGYSFQGGAFRAGWTRGKREPGIGAELKHSLRSPGEWRLIFVAYAESLPRAENRLTLDPAKRDRWGMPLLQIAFAHGENEKRALADAAAEARAMAQAAGGTVTMSLERPGPGGSSIHEMGGARMGNDPKTSVLDHLCRSHDIPNLFVTDGAAMASSACQNPSLTYMALTARACEGAVAMLKQDRL